MGFKFLIFMSNSLIQPWSPPPLHLSVLIHQILRSIDPTSSPSIVATSERSTNEVDAYQVILGPTTRPSLFSPTNLKPYFIEERHQASFHNILRQVSWKHAYWVTSVSFHPNIGFKKILLHHSCMLSPSLTLPSPYHLKTEKGLYSSC